MPGRSGQAAMASGDTGRRHESLARRTAGPATPCARRPSPAGVAPPTRRRLARAANWPFFRHQRGDQFDVFLPGKGQRERPIRGPHDTARPADRGGSGPGRAEQGRALTEQGRAFDAGPAATRRAQQFHGQCGPAGQSGRRACCVQGRAVRATGEPHRSGSCPVLRRARGGGGDDRASPGQRGPPAREDTGAPSAASSPPAARAAGRPPRRREPNREAARPVRHCPRRDSARVMKDVARGRAGLPGGRD